MEESYLPWWLILLLGMWAASFAVWQHPRVNPEIRHWAGIATWVYLLLSFVALSIGLTSAGTAVISQGVTQAGVVVCIVLGVSASVWMWGPFSEQSQIVGYVIFTLASAGICLLMSSVWLAAGLGLLALLSAKPLLLEGVRNWRRSRLQVRREQWMNLFRIERTSDRSETPGVFALSGILNCVLACVLIGTLAYSIRVENTRTNHSPRFSALPSREGLASRERLEKLHRRQASSTTEPAMTESSLSSRVDLIVLLAALVFMRLAMLLDDHAKTTDANNSVEAPLPAR